MRSRFCKVRCISTIVDLKEHINGFEKAMVERHLTLQECTFLCLWFLAMQSFDTAHGAPGLP